MVELGGEGLLVLGGTRANMSLLSNPLLFSVLPERYGDHVALLGGRLLRRHDSAAEVRVALGTFSHYCVSA